MTPTQRVEQVLRAIVERPGITEITLQKQLGMNARDMSRALDGNLRYHGCIWYTFTPVPGSSHQTRCFFSKVWLPPLPPE
jgi:hypothetical protein